MFKEISSLLRATPAVQTKFAGDAGTFEGYASLFGGEPDSYGDIVEPGAFGNSLDKFAVEKTMPPMLWSHDPSAPIGKWIEIRQDSKGLAVVGQLNLSSDRGRQAHAHLKEGDISGLSIGYRIPPGGRVSLTDGTAKLTEIDLLEISAVTMPAARRARISNVKSITSQADLERILRENGLARGAAIKLAAGGWPALLGDDAESLGYDQLLNAVQSANHHLKGILK